VQILTGDLSQVALADVPDDDVASEKVVTGEPLGV